MKNKLFLIVVFFISFAVFTNIVDAAVCPGDDISIGVSGSYVFKVEPPSGITCDFDNNLMSELMKKALLGTPGEIINAQKANVTCHLNGVRNGSNYIVKYDTYNSNIFDTISGLGNSDYSFIKSNTKKITIDSEEKCSKEAKDNSDEIKKKSHDDLSKATDFCSAENNPQVLAGFRFIGYIIVIVKILVPIILIVMGMIDISKAVVDGAEGNIQKSVVNFIKRVILGVLIFFVPTLIKAIFESFSDLNNKWSSVGGQNGEYNQCLECMLDPNNCPDVSLINTK